ncbi:HDOD domain-containing protein [Rosettibacter firmus]|uniref:HDOD domain-containing protein n=1 Tax=Rosettibacter firmus TaxID=3111522 RepID=UPI00336C29EE
MDVIKKIIEGVNNLPTLPTIYTTLSEAMENPNTTKEELAKIISTDQAASFKILKVANSPFYGLRGRVDTITQALLYLGFNEVKNIVFALSVINSFTRNKLFTKFKPTDLWAHSIGVGVATRIIGAAIGEKNLENYFLAGIFHDIGKLIFFEYVPNEYSKVIHLVESKNIPIKDAELEILGINHARAGQLIAEKWKLPQTVVNIVSAHHTGLIGFNINPLLASVHLGDIIARAMELGYGGDNFIPEPNIKIWDAIKLPKGFFSTARKKIKDDYERLVKIMLSD